MIPVECRDSSTDASASEVEKDDLETLRRAVKLRALSGSWRGYFQKRIQKLEPPAVKPEV